MSDDAIEIIQGTTHSYRGSTIGFLNLFDGSKVQLSVWRGSGEDGLTQLSLRAGDVFAAGGRFLRVSAATDGPPRARLQLDPLADAGGLQAPAADHPLLVEGGELQVGGMRARLEGAVSADGAAIEYWPMPHPRERTADRDVQRATLAAGQDLRIGDRALRVVRLQPDAGEILGFVELSPAQ